MRPGKPLTVSALEHAIALDGPPCALRDALARLEGETLVTSVRNRGYRVLGVSLADLRDLQGARLVVEVELLRDSILTGDDEWQKRILLAHWSLARAPVLQREMEEHDYSVWEIAHENFHLALVSDGKNSWLMRYLGQLHAQVRRYQRKIALGTMSLADPQTDKVLSFILRSTSDIAHHTLLMEATLDRDAERAAALLRQHIGPVVSAEGSRSIRDVDGRHDEGSLKDRNAI